MVVEATATVASGPTWRRDKRGRFVLPKHTLGWQILGWTADYLQHPDGPKVGEPWRFSDEQARLLLWWFAVDKRGGFVYRSGLLRRMKGWGKDPFGTAICCVELVGPSRFSHWGEDGQPVGQAHPAAWILVAAVARDQTRTTMPLFGPMLSGRGAEGDVYTEERNPALFALQRRPRDEQGHRPQCRESRGPRPGADERPRAGGGFGRPARLRDGGEDSARSLAYHRLSL